MFSQPNCCCGSEFQIDPPWSNSHCFIAITGASRGFGQALCGQLTSALSALHGQANSVHFLLLARDLAALEKTSTLIHSSKFPGSSTQINVLISHPPLDMQEANETNLEEAIKPLVDLATSEKYRNEKQWNLLIHNAATLGVLENRADERTDLPYMHSYYHLNLFAPIILTSVFLRHFAPVDSEHPPLTVLNISSLAAEKAFSHMTDYCVGKAARQMYLRSLAVDRPTIAVFNYSPGPLDTDMYSDLCERIGNERSRQAAQDNKRSRRLIDPAESARVCVAWLRRRHSTAFDGQTVIPKAMVCPVHDRDYIDLWRGARLDYYDAVTRCKTPTTGNIGPNQ